MPPPYVATFPTMKEVPTDERSRDQNPEIASFSFFVINFFIDSATVLTCSIQKGAPFSYQTLALFRDCIMQRSIGLRDQWCYQSTPAVQDEVLRIILRLESSFRVC